MPATAGIWPALGKITIAFAGGTGAPRSPSREGTHRADPSPAPSPLPAQVTPSLRVGGTPRPPSAWPARAWLLAPPGASLPRCPGLQVQPCCRCQARLPSTHTPARWPECPRSRCQRREDRWLVVRLYPPASPSATAGAAEGGCAGLPGGLHLR